jgi:hypothetical protein
MAELKREYRERTPDADARYPEKIRARNRLNLAIRRGRLVKPRECGSCEQVVASRCLHGHHPDYSKPLEVEWLCAACHSELHRKAAV